MDGVGRKVRVHDDRLHTGCAQLGYAAAGFGGLRHGRLGTPNNDDLCFVVRCGTEDLLHRVVGNRLVIASVEQLRQGPTRQIALRAAGLEDGWRTHGHRERHGLHERIRAAASYAGEERIRSVLLNGVGDVGCRLIDGFVPGDLLPLVGAALNVAQGVKHAARTVHSVNLIQAFDAQAAAAHGSFRIPFELHDDTVFQVCDGWTHLNAAMATGAHRGVVVQMGSERSFVRLLFSFLRFHASRKGSADGRDGRGHRGRFHEVSASQVGFRHSLLLSRSRDSRPVRLTHRVPPTDHQIDTSAPPPSVSILYPRPERQHVQACR